MSGLPPDVYDYGAPGAHVPHEGDAYFLAVVSRSAQLVLGPFRSEGEWMEAARPYANQADYRCVIIAAP